MVHRRGLPVRLILSLNQRLERLAADHARQIDSLVDSVNAAVRAIYEDAGEDAARLRTGLTRAVDGARKSAHALATTHVLEELRAVAGEDAGRVSLSMGPTPERDEVARYIDNAVQAARDDGFVATMYRGETIVESETITTYTEGRAAAEASIAATPRDQADKIGFRVARSESELRETPAIEVRADEGGSIPIIAKKWSAINDRRTCPICRDIDGRLAILTGDFGGLNTPAHARCRCITHLTSLGYVKTEKAMRYNEERVIRFDVETRADPRADRVVSVVASDETLDGHGSIIRASGWDLSRYRKNPVVLWAHAGGGPFSQARPKDVLATAPNVRVDGTKLIAEIQFPPEGVNDEADLVYRQMLAKVIRGVSVGFKPLEYHYENEGGDNEIVIVDRAELVELSIVPVPSNQNALARAVRALADTCAPGCGCHSAERSAGDTMDNPKEVTQVLPPPIAALLGVDSVEAARGAIAALQLRADESNKVALAERARADAAEAKLSERIDAETRAIVDGLVKAGRVSETLRESALTLARADIGAFRAMYPEQATDAPKRADLEKRIVPVSAPKPAPKALEVSAAHVAAIVQKHLSNGANYVEAHERAMAELASKE